MKAPKEGIKKSKKQLRGALISREITLQKRQLYQKAFSL